MVSFNYFSLLLLIISVYVVIGGESSSNGSSSGTEQKSSNITKISWYADNKNKEKSEGNKENVEQKADSQGSKSGEKVQNAFSEVKSNKNSTKESGDEKSKGNVKQDKDLSIEDLLKTMKTENVAQSSPSSTTPPSNGYYSSYENSDNDYDNYASTFPYTPFYPEDPYGVPYEDNYPPIPPPYPYTRYPAPSYQESLLDYPQNYYPSEFPAPPPPLSSWFDPNYYPDETFDDSNNANNFYSGESYSSSDEIEVDKRHTKSINPLDMVYRLNEPVFLDKPCPCSGFATDTQQYKRHAFPPKPSLPFGTKDDRPFKIDLPKPQWIEKLKQLREEKTHKTPAFEPSSHVKSRSANGEESPLPSEFNEDGPGSGFGRLFEKMQVNKKDEETFF